jgi:uncharacterized membrane protein YagU involved in acid resistance
MKRLLRGALAGGLATAPMSAVMMGAKQLGLVGEMPPEKITAKFLNRAGIRRSEVQQDVLATLTHFGFGAAAGAAFGVIAPRRLIARLPMGMAYGAAIWGVSYMGWVPALGIMPPADRDRRDRQMVMLASHLVYGTALALLVGARQGEASADR